MRSSKRNKFLFAFLLFFQIAFAQTIPSKNITINDGLPSNGIKCFFKDSRGLMWIGTDAGLCCYDGSTYKTFTDSNGFNGDKVWSIVEDENKNIWISLYGKGLAKYDGKKFSYYDEKDGLVNNSIRKIHYSKKYKCLILATENGLTLFDGKKFKSFTKENKERGFQIVGINETAGNIVITSSYFGDFKLSIHNPISTSKLDSISLDKIKYSSFISKQSYLSSGPDKKLAVKNVVTGKEDLFSCPIVWDYAKDKRDNIYLAAWNVNDPNGGLFKYYNNKLTDITTQAHITSTSLWCLLYDEENQQLWVGSTDKGIFRVDLSNNIKFLESSFFGMKELQIQELYNDLNNTTWIGAIDNIVLLDKGLQYRVFDRAILFKKIVAYFKQHKIDKEDELGFKVIEDRFGFTSFNIVSDREANIWVSTTLGVFCFDKNYEFKFCRLYEGGHLVFDKKDQVYFARMYTEFYFLPNKFDWSRYTMFFNKDSATPKDISKIVYDGKRLWFASNSKGLFLHENNRFFSLNANGLFKENNIKDLIINDKGQLVIGTNSGKVYITKWDGRKLNILHTYNPFKEIFGSSISFIEQSNGHYFIGTNKGINVVKNNKFVKLINKSEGLNDIQFNDCIKDKKGNLWVATNNGLIQLNSKEISKNENTQTTPIKITNIKVNGEPFAKNTALFRWGGFENSKLILDYDQNDIEIEFLANNSFNPNKNVYRYKIVGLSKNWSEFEPDGKIQLLGVPNGNYELLIEGKNTGTATIFISKQLNLIVTPPFWKTWWFVMGNFILIAVIGFLFSRNRVRTVKRREQSKARVQKRMAETKMEALQSQMNPHFIFNAMNSIQHYIIDNNTDDALMYMGEFSKLIRQTLNNSSKQRITLSDELQYLKSYIKLENMRLKDEVDFNLDVDTDIDLFEVELPPMLIQPFIENVFVHAFDSNSKDPTLTLTFKRADNFLYCEIKDNGKGMAGENLNKLHNSKGIKLAKERIALFQADTVNPVVITSTPQQGTTVIILLDSSSS